MFRAHVLIIRRSKLHYTASGINTPIGGCLMHRLREDTLNLCMSTLVHYIITLDFKSVCYLRGMFVTSNFIITTAVTFPDIQRKYVMMPAAMTSALSSVKLLG